MANDRKLIPRKRLGIAGLIVAGTLIAGMVVTMTSSQNTPSVLEVDFRSHRAVPAIIQMSLNGRMVIDRSQKGRSESGPIEYLSGHGGALDFDVAWYDIFEGSGQALKFRLHVSDLTVYGVSRIASVSVVVGPGADVAVTTTHLDVARLITERRDDALANLPAVPDIVLAELCAEQLDGESPLVEAFRLDVERYKDTGQRAANDGARARYIADNGPVTPRCPQPEA